VGRGPVGEVAERAFTDLAILAVCLAQQDGRGRVPVRDGLDIHGRRGVELVIQYKSQICEYMATFQVAILPFLQDFRRFDSIGKREAGVNRH
jgi:hypothetical protein